MRPRRAAQPPAAPAGLARSTIGAVAHRGEDPPRDGGIAAGSARRVVIIRPPGIHARPASRSSFSGLAFDDPHDVEGAHVRHDPPSPRPAQGREPPPPASAPRARTLRPGASYRRWHRRIFLPISAEQATRFLIPDRGSALSGTARRPVPKPSGTGRCRDVFTRLPAGGVCASPWLSSSSTRQHDAPGSGVSRMWARPCRSATHWVVTSSTVAPGAVGRTSPGAATVHRVNLGVTVTPAGVVDEQPPRCRMGHIRYLQYRLGPGSGCGRTRPSRLLRRLVAGRFGAGDRRDRAARDLGQCRCDHLVPVGGGVLVAERGPGGGVAEACHSSASVAPVAAASTAPVSRRPSAVRRCSAASRIPCCWAGVAPRRPQWV